MQMQESADGNKKVLILYFSFSSQTNNLVLALTKGLEEAAVTVQRERLVPRTQLRFPIGTIRGTFKMMLVTFVRKRIPIEPLDPSCFADFDLIILAGPTWSYNPSGPVLSLFDRDGKKLFKGKLVIPLISCRGYWRLHWWGLKQFLCRSGAKVVNLIVFSHPAPEPWRTIGVFLKLTGRIPEKSSWFSGKYKKYGHSRRQLKEARRFGRIIGRELREGGKKLHLLNFDTEISLP